MFPLYLWLVGLAGIAALGVHLANRHLNLGWNTSARIIVAFLAGTALALAPLTAWAGYTMGKNSALSYNEFWNGVETGTSVATTPCTRDGACRHEYSCDPYTVVTTSTDANGKTTTHTETKWHDCPYVDREYTYVVHTTLGDNVVGDHWFPTNPEAHRWRPSVHGLPNVPSGIPAAYAAAKARIDAGNPGGVTKPAKYKNYFLASEDPVLTRHSAALAKYRDAHLLPDTSRYTGDMKASKVHVVGTLPPGTSLTDWTDTLAHLNAALGTELQGDLHVVIVTTDQVTSPDEYASALRAHWWSKEMGKDTFAKNGIAVVLGSKPGATSIEWARAFTGMPEGNRGLEVQLTSELVGAPFTPQAALGAPKVTNVGSDDPVFAHTDGIADQALWGPNKYVRVCMGCDDADDTGQGYVYLASNVDAPTGAKVATVIVGTLLNGAVLAALLALFPAAAPAGSGRRLRYLPGPGNPYSVYR